MDKETKKTLIALIPSLINDNIEYESDLSLLLRNKGYTNLRIGDIRKLLKTLDITLKQGKQKNNGPISIPDSKKEKNKKGRRSLTWEELQSNSEKRRYKYQRVIDLLIEEKYSYKEIAEMCNVTDSTIARIKKEFINNEERYNKNGR